MGDLDVDEDKAAVVHAGGGCSLTLSSDHGGIMIPGAFENAPMRISTSRGGWDSAGGAIPSQIPQFRNTNANGWKSSFEWDGAGGMESRRNFDNMDPGCGGVTP